MIRNGENKDISEEEGKNKLEKERERIEEGKSEVEEIIKYKGEWMIKDEKEKKEDDVEKDDRGENKGDKEMENVYMSRLINVFCKNLKYNMLEYVRKERINMIKKMVNYIKKYLIVEE
jgi:hypothetical protein